MAVGVFDSGLGGLTVLDAARARLPDVPFVYYADSAHAPYGVRDSEDIYQRTKKAVEYLAYLPFIKMVQEKLEILHYHMLQQ